MKCRSASLALVFAMIVSSCGANVAPTESDLREVYVSVREGAATGNLAEAAQMTDEPATFINQMEQARSRLGPDQFQALMLESVTDIDVHGFATSGDHSVLILNFALNGREAKAATFFVERDGETLEMIEPTGEVPCVLYDRFYEAQGQSNAKAVSCRE